MFVAFGESRRRIRQRRQSADILATKKRKRRATKKRRISSFGNGLYSVVGKNRKLLRSDCTAQALRPVIALCFSRTRDSPPPEFGTLQYSGIVVMLKRRDPKRVEPISSSKQVLFLEHDDII